MATRMTPCLVAALAALCVAPVPTPAQDAHADHAAPGPQAAAAAKPRDPNLPPGETDAKAALETSPRHGEWVDVKRASGPAIRAYVVYPERKDKAPVVIVIHEIFGLSDWVRGVADQLAKEGFIAVAPDLISGMGPNGGGSDAVPNRDDVVKLIRGLEPVEADARLDAVRDYALKLPAAKGKSATIGFCWGGGRSFAYAASHAALNAAVVYYGSAPEADALAGLKVPVLGLYGGDDARITSTVEGTAAAVAKLGRRYEHEVYDGAGHGFLRDQAGRDGANAKATLQAWPRTLTFLKQELEGG